MRVVVVSGASNALAQQIIAGSPADIFIPAHDQWLDSLADQGQRLGGKHLLAGNRLALVTRKSNPLGLDSAEDLTSPRVTRVAIGGSNVPVGQYARQFLDSVDFTGSLAVRKIIPAPNAATIVTWLGRGEVDAAFVYASDVSDEFHVVAEIPASSHAPILYSAVCVGSADSRDEVAALLDYLSGDRAQELFRSSGFTTGMPVAGSKSGN